MSTYIPRQIKPVRERIEVKLDRGIIVELERYSEYLDSERDYIIAQALTVAFRRDKGFAEWVKTHPVNKPVLSVEIEQVIQKPRSEK